MSAHVGIVYVLDDEPEMVKALSRVLRVWFDVRGFTSVKAFLAGWLPDQPACLVLDLAMPELDGLEIQRQLILQRAPISIVFLTGHGDIPMSVQAIKAGAVDFLTKPVDEARLVPAVRAALNAAEANAALIRRFAKLTPRERQVMEQVVAGKLNKQIAADLGTGEHNIKLHRAHVMQKMAVDSLADLVRAAQHLGIGG